MYITEEKHNYGIDLLRIAAMLIIVAHHFSLHSGIVFESTSLQGTIMSVFALGGKTGVNIFVLITGFCSSGTIRWRKVVNILGCTVFYSLVLFFLAILTGSATWSSKTLIKACAPFLFGNNYWFVVTYLLLYILIPVLSKVTKDLNERDYGIYLLIFTFVQCLLPTVAAKFVQTNDFGFSSLTWFVYLYFLGAYLRKYNVFARIGSKMYYLLGITIIVQIAACIAIHWEFANGILGQILECFADYSSNAISPLVISVLSLGIFEKLDVRFGKKTVMKIGAATLGVYLIHDNHAFRGWLWTAAYNLVTCAKNLPFIFVALLVVLLVYVVCSTIEIFRSAITTKLRCWIKSKQSGNKLR